MMIESDIILDEITDLEEKMEDQSSDKKSAFIAGYQCALTDVKSAIGKIILRFEADPEERIP